MKFKINSNPSFFNYIILLIIFFYYLFLLILFNKNFIWINKTLLKNHKFFYTNNNIYYKHLTYKNIILINNKKDNLPMVFYSFQQKVNNFYKIINGHGIKGWIPSNKIKYEYRWILWLKTENQPIEIINIMKNSNGYIIFYKSYESNSLRKKRFIEHKIITNNQWNKIFF